MSIFWFQHFWLLGTVGKRTSQPEDSERSPCKNNSETDMIAFVLKINTLHFLSATKW